MNAYQAGLRVGLGGGTTFGPVDVQMPRAQQDEIASIAAAFKTLDREIQGRRAQLQPAWVKGWDDFRDSWQTFAQGHSTWLSNVWYASYQKAIEYRQRLDDWRRRLEALTGPLSVPTLSARPPEEKPFPWRGVLYAGLAIGGAFAISSLLKRGTDAKREVFGDRTLIDAHHALAGAGR